MIILVGLAIIIYVVGGGARTSSSKHDSSTVARVPSGGDGWYHMRTIGLIDMIVVHPKHEHDLSKYIEAINAVCAVKVDFCKVMVWNDPHRVPVSMPMSAWEVKAMRANWTINKKTGARSEMFSCDIDPDRTKCFSH